ncbi:MAG: MFS transporter [Bacteriovoracaceae bacterium]|nr:MFS transporter [Bacteriovoracaceae bacterium]
MNFFRVRLSGTQGFHYHLLIAAFIGLFYFGIFDNGRGPAYPEIMRGLGLSNRQGSFLFALTSLTSFFMTALSSRWLKVLDLLKGMRFSWLILALASFMMGLAGILQNAFLLFLAAITQGIGMGITGMNMNLMIEAGSPVSHRRRAYGALHAIYGVASFLAPLVFTGIKKIGLSWEYFFFFLSTVGPIIFFLVPHKEEIYAKIPDQSKALHLPLPFLILLGLTVGTYVASEIVISSRLVLFLEDGYQLTNAHAGYYLSAFFILLMSGRLLLGLVNLPFKGATLLISSLLITGIFCYLGMQGQLFFFSLTGLSMSFFFPSFMDWMAETFPNDFQKVTKFVLSGIGLHLVVMHLGFGQLADKIGVIKAMGLALFLTGTSLIFLIGSLFWTQKVKAANH